MSGHTDDMYHSRECTKGSASYPWCAYGEFLFLEIVDVYHYVDVCVPLFMCSCVCLCQCVVHVHACSCLGCLCL